MGSLAAMVIDGYSLGQDRCRASPASYKTHLHGEALGQGLLGPATVSPIATRNAGSQA